MPGLRIGSQSRRSQGRRNRYSLARNGGFENAASGDEWSLRRAACIAQQAPSDCGPTGARTALPNLRHTDLVNSVRPAAGRPFDSHHDLPATDDGKRSTRHVAIPQTAIAHLDMDTGVV